MSLNSMKSKLPFKDKVVNQDTKIERESMIKMYRYTVNNLEKD